MFKCLRTVCIYVSVWLIHLVRKGQHLCTLIRIILNPLLHPWIRNHCLYMRWFINHAVFPLIFKFGNDNFTKKKFSSCRLCPHKEGRGLPVVGSVGSLVGIPFDSLFCNHTECRQFGGHWCNYTQYMF